jgi:hypothetical protein
MVTVSMGMSGGDLIQASRELERAARELERAARRCERLAGELGEARAARDRLLVDVTRLGMSRRQASRVARVSLSSVQQTLERAGVVAPVPSRRHRYVNRDGVT